MIWKPTFQVGDTVQINVNPAECAPVMQGWNRIVSRIVMVSTPSEEEPFYILEINDLIWPEHTLCLTTRLPDPKFEQGDHIKVYYTSGFPHLRRAVGKTGVIESAMYSDIVRTWIYMVKLDGDSSDKQYDIVEDLLSYASEPMTLSTYRIRLKLAARQDHLTYAKVAEIIKKIKNSSEE